ncbi:hypothetical protein GOP47_0023070 [Adiantum capillus-veneris]|uniref:Uncharacterized protein n=1 Tax=Adiantum capillus-veneris TaxID=13818 RepID=A0A9D4Z7H6_ADICA|nr:hypothetical protein GOP47_0023070 [Adiantum capillus-veneris]
MKQGIRETPKSRGRKGSFHTFSTITNKGHNEKNGIKVFALASSREKTLSSPCITLIMLLEKRAHDRKHPWIAWTTPKHMGGIAWTDVGIRRGGYLCKLFAM